MLNYGKNFTLCATKKINILTLALSEKKILNGKKTYPPPCKLNGRSLSSFFMNNFIEYIVPIFI